MNVVKSNWLSSLLILAAGVVLCCLYDKGNLINVIIYIIGALFTSTGCINIINISMRRSEGKTGTITTVIGWIAGLAGIGVGAAMLITPPSFHKILIYVFAVALILGAIWHVFLIAYYYKGYHLPVWLYISPLLILAGGIIIVCSTDIRTKIAPAILITGICCVIFAVTTLLEYIFAKEYESEQAKLHKTDKKVAVATQGVNTVKGKTLTESIKDAVTIPQQEEEADDSTTEKTGDN